MSTLENSVIKSKNLINAEVVYWCRIIMMLFNFLPIMTGYFGAMPVAPFVGIIFVIIIFGNMSFVGKNAGAILFFSIFCFMSSILRNVIGYLTIYNLASFLVSAFSMMYLIYYGKTEYIKKLVLITIILMAITEITTIIGTKIYPEAPRFLITEDAADSQKLYTYTRMNIGGFSMAYAMPGLLVNLYILAKNKVINKIVFILFTVLALVFAFSIQFTMSIILISISVVVILVSYNKPKKFIRNGIILMVIGLMSTSYISMFLANISESAESEILTERFNDASMMLEGEELKEKSAGNARMEAYEKTINLIKSDFTLGGIFSGKGSGGGHSSFGDFVAAFGILGWAVLIFMIYFMYNSIYKGIKGTEYFKPMVFSQIMFILPLIVNNINSGSYYWLMFGTSAATVYLVMKEDDEPSNVIEEQSVKKIARSVVR